MSDSTTCDRCGKDAEVDAFVAALKAIWFDPVTGQDLLITRRTNMFCSDACRHMWIFGP